MKKIFNKWFDRGNKNLCVISYKGDWDKPQFCIRTNGARRKNGDSCFDFFIQLFYLDINYTNFDLQGKCNGKSIRKQKKEK